MEHINRIEIQGVVGPMRINTFCDGINNRPDERVANFMVATDRITTNHWGDVVAETMWHNVVAWESKCDFTGLEKGCNVRVVGRMRTTSYTDAKGNYKTRYEVEAHELSIIKE